MTTLSIKTEGPEVLHTFAKWLISTAWQLLDTYRNTSQVTRKQIN